MMLSDSDLNFDKFKIVNEGKEIELVGSVYIVDKYGTFEDESDVSYDIMVEESPLHNNTPCLFKHLREDRVEPVK